MDSFALCSCSATRPARTAACERAPVLPGCTRCSHSLILMSAAHLLKNILLHAAAGSAILTEGSEELLLTPSEGLRASR